MGRDFGTGSCRACQAKRAFLLPSLLSSFSPVFYSLFSLPKPKIMSECLPPGRSGSAVWWQGEILPCLVALPSLCAPASSWVTGIFHQDLPGGGSAPARGFGADSELCGALGRSLLMPSPGSTWSRALQVEERYCMVTLSSRNHLFGSPHPLPATASASPGPKWTTEPSLQIRAAHSLCTAAQPVHSKPKE